MLDHHLRIRAENFTENDVAHHDGRRHSRKDEDDADDHLFRMGGRNITAPGLFVNRASASLRFRHHALFVHGYDLMYKLPFVRAVDEL